MLIHLLPGALSFLLTLILVIDWALHRRSLVWYAGPLLVGAVALFQLGERYLLDLLLGGGAGGVLGWIVFKFPIDWMTLRWQRRVWIRTITSRSRDPRELIGARGVRLSALAAKKLAIAPTWVVTPAAMLDHIGHTPLEEDIATLAGHGSRPDERALAKLAQRAHEIIVGEPLPWALRQAFARAWNDMGPIDGDLRALLMAWPTVDQSPIERATLWPRRWRVAQDLEEMCESLLELWAENHSVAALRHRRDRGEALVDLRLAVALQPLPAVAWSGLAASADPRGGVGWLVECWPGESLFEGRPPTHRRAPQGRAGGESAREPTALIVAQASRAAQMAAHALGSPVVIAWRATRGEEVTVMDAAPLRDLWDRDGTPPRSSAEGWEWGARIAEFSGTAIASLPSGPSEALCAGRVFHTERLPTRWHPSHAALSGWVVCQASILGDVAAACREASQGLILTHGAPPGNSGGIWSFRDQGGAPAIIPN